MHFIFEAEDRATCIYHGNSKLEGVHYHHLNVTVSDKLESL